MRQLTLRELWSKRRSQKPVKNLEIEPPTPPPPPSPTESCVSSESAEKCDGGNVEKSKRRSDGDDGRGESKKVVKKRRRGQEVAEEVLNIVVKEGGMGAMSTRYSLRSRGRLRKEAVMGEGVVDGNVEDGMLVASGVPEELKKKGVKGGGKRGMIDGKKENDERGFVGLNVFLALRNAEHGRGRVGLDLVGSLMVEKTAGLRLDSMYAEQGRRLKRIYAMDVSNDGKHVAAGGHGGIVELLKLPFRKIMADGSFQDEHEYNMGITSELVQTKCRVWTLENHLSWVSDTCFSASGHVVLSSSNDGTIIAVETHTGHELCTLSGTQAHHNSGIYSMDIAGDENVASTAKDGSLRISRLLPSGEFQALDLLADAHEGVAKCVRWRKHDIRVLATCGNDKMLRIFDTRAMAKFRKATLECLGSLSRACNTVAWHPSDSNLLLSCGFAENILIHDVRHLGAKPLHTMHSHSSKASGGGIRHPAFYISGEAILAASSPSTTLTQYMTRSGKVSERHDIDCQPPNVISVHDTSNTVVLPFGSTGKLASFRPFRL
eukprot:Plantae.Rhodophyta-Hildenbrandia_rubra.ctg13331.p1 GENE.Plantae.Rhodophyta-Hildenbrandia_rubra.ctg13331~~Plantae.Rhodophyta-Hildenbrandia_rubra.ctg13331.p1  ORF type:complete len:547 (+),score=100.40 Plantae.Rhodophyta-Hildenbrandia_rubra.ctg13331:179-1819(+)